MKYMTLPGTDLTVAQLALGTMNFGSAISTEDSFQQMDSYYASGGNFLDTARFYANWIENGANASERTIGAWLRKTGLRDKVVLASKCAHPDREARHIHRITAPDIAADLERSLHYLDTPVIDLYWLHRDAPQVPVSEIIDMMNVHIQAGQVRYIACSNWAVERIEAANAYAAQQGLQGFVANQPMWSLARPNIANLPDATWEVIDLPALAWHRQAGLPVVAYTPQARGYFTKRAEHRLSDGDRAWYDNATNTARFACAQQLAQQYGVSLNAIALAYITSQPFPAAAIIGPRTQAQMQDCLTAADLTLTPEDIRALEVVA